MPPIPRPKNILDGLPDAAKRVADQKAQDDIHRARSDHNALVEQRRAEADRRQERAEVLIIQRRVFDQLQDDARQIADHLRNQGVNPVAGQDGCHSLDVTDSGAPANFVHHGRIWNPDTRLWEVVPAGQTAGLGRDTTSIWPLRVTRTLDEKKSKPGHPVFKKTGFGMIAETGELVLFEDRDTSRGDELLDLHAPRTAGSWDHRPIVPDDIITRKAVDVGEPAENQPVLLGLQEQLVQLAAEQLAGATSEPIWTNK